MIQQEAGTYPAAGLLYRDTMSAELRHALLASTRLLWSFGWFCAGQLWKQRGTLTSAADTQGFPCAEQMPDRIAVLLWPPQAICRRTTTHGRPQQISSSWSPRPLWAGPTATHPATSLLVGLPPSPLPLQLPAAVLAISRQCCPFPPHPWKAASLLVLGYKSEQHPGLWGCSMLPLAAEACHGCR